MYTIIRIWRRSLVISGVALAFTLGLTVTAVRAAGAPDSGTALEGARTQEKPAEQVSTPEIKVAEPASNAAAAGGQRILVSGFCFSGQLPVPEVKLQQVAADQVGLELTLADLNRLADKVTKYLRDNGYPVASAYIPAQTITDGKVAIVVIPGKYGAITLNNQAGISDGQLLKIISPLKVGDVVTQARLERVLLLVNDLPGIAVKATLAPGEVFGTTKLTLNISNTAKIDGVFYTDNWGNRFTGRYRGGFNAGVENIGHCGDRLQVGGLTAGERLNSLNLSYSLPLTYDGMRIAANYSHVDYTLGEDFAALDASGNAIVKGFNVSCPFIRTRKYSLYGTMGFNYKDLYDELAVSSTVTPRTSQTWNFGIKGQIKAKAGVSNQFDLTYFHGDLWIHDENALETDVSSAKTEGGFCKLLLNYRRQQNLTSRLSMDWRFTGQIASVNLDSSEKLYLGGADGVRAYPQGEAAVDEGSLTTLEFKWLMVKSDRSNLYLANFYDYGHGKVNDDPWSATTDNYRNLGDAGLGLLWVRPRFDLRLDYAWKLGPEDAKSDTDRNGRLWLQCVKYF